MISISDRARDHLQKLMEQENCLGHGLRISIKSGGCSGLSYRMRFEPHAGAEDREFESNGIRIFLDLFSAMYLQNTELDYTDGLNGSGFVFRNPNAKRTCGCGQSFSA